MTGLSLLHPLIALGALGVAAPVIIHFIFRRRAKNLEFPAMRFVLMSYKKVARRLLLQEYLLLAARCLMVALLALALAGPLYSRIVAGISRGDKPMAVMIVLDTSLSMTRSREGRSLLEEAKKNISDWLGQLRGNDKVGLLDAVSLTGTGLTNDPGKVREAMEKMEAAYRPARQSQALLLSASLLSDQAGMDRMILVFTDLQRTGWTRSGEGGAELPPIYIMDMASGLTPDNLSLSNLEIRRKSLARQEAVEVEAEVENHGDRDARKVLLRVGFGDEISAQGFVDAAAGDMVKKLFMLTDYPGGAGTVRIEASDGIQGDNVAYFHLLGGREVMALLVDGEPGTGYLESETYFLDQALNPRLYSRSKVHPKAVTVAEFEKENLDDYRVLVLANVARPSPAPADKVKEFVGQGGGLLITLGDNVDADIYNAALGDLLPRELRGVKLSYAGARGSSEVRMMHLEMPAPGPERHPILSIFQDPSQGDLGLAGFSKYFLVQQQVESSSRVVLRLTDGTPMMVEGRYGRGKVIMFNSTADRAWNDLCIRPTYLPLFQQTVQYLADALMMEDEGRMAAGSVVEIPVASEVMGARVLTPGGGTHDCDLISEVGARRVRVVNTELPGIYYLKYTRGSEKPATRFSPGEADRIMVINLDPAESDLAGISPDEIKAMTGAGQVMVISPDAPLDPEAPSAVQTSSYSWILLWVLAGLAVLERGLTRKG